VVGKRQDQVHVGRKIQLAATELAHADHAHARDRAVAAPRPAIARGLLLLDMAQRAFDAVFGEAGGARQRGQRRFVVAQVIDQDAQAGRTTKAAQRFGEILAALEAVRIGQGRRRLRNHIVEELLRRAQGGFDQPVAHQRRGRRIVPPWPAARQTVFHEPALEFVVALAEEGTQFGNASGIGHRRSFARRKLKARRDPGSRRAALPFGLPAGAART
jgi:hypothetical protein